MVCGGCSGFRRGIILTFRPDAIYRHQLLRVGIIGRQARRSDGFAFGFLVREFEIQF